jgi:hypothetical protein
MLPKPCEMMEEERKPEEPGGLPWGVRLAAGFLDFFVIAIALPTFFAALGTIPLLTLAFQSPGNEWKALGSCWLGFGAYLVLVAMMNGADWLAKYLRAGFWESTGSRWKADPPGSFARKMMVPVLVSVVIYSMFAVAAGCLAKLKGDSESFAWLIAWTIAGGACYYLLERYFGRGFGRGNAWRGQDGPPAS